VAFTNPILAGEELNRTGIRSENYVPAVSGWRVANDGAAEFDNVGLRGNLWVPTITLNGQDLNTRINNLPKGCIAFITGYPVVQTATEIQVMQVEADIVTGRYYEVYLTNLTTDVQTGADSVEFKLRWTLGTPPPALSTSSDIVANGLRQSIFNQTVLRYSFWSGATTRMRIGVYMASLNGSNVRTWAPGAGANLVVLDHGTAPYAHPGQGVIGSGSNVRTLKEFTITATNSRTYNSNGTLRTDQYATNLVMGDWQNGRGNQRAWWFFTNSDVSTYIDDLIGVPQADIVEARVRLAPLQYGNEPLGQYGIISLGFHNQVGPWGTGNEPSGGIPNVHRVSVSGTDPIWININPNDPGIPNNFWGSMRDGYLNGFMVGNTFSGWDYAVVCQGTGGWQYYPQLYMKYWK